MHGVLTAIASSLPERVLSSADLAREYPDWSMEKIEEKTGIARRHIAADGECASDLACAAALKLFACGACSPAEVDYVLFCTQTPDYLLPTTACVMQQRLGLPTRAGALDFNLGCSGYVYGLSLANGLIAAGHARCVLLLTGDTYSKFIDPADRSVRTLFGDAGAASIVRAREGARPKLGPFVFGTDGRGGANLIVHEGGARKMSFPGAANGAAPRLVMNGPEIFRFTLESVPAAVDALLAKAGLSRDEIDLFVFHQANAFMLDHLRRKMGIAESRFALALRDVGNTVSSSIPLALEASARSGQLRNNALVMVVGFGVGYSWAAGLVRWEQA
jgi:3-oxoacyl-[acyl-carrier-protein] synthase-3